CIIPKKSSPIRVNCRLTIFLSKHAEVYLKSIRGAFRSLLVLAWLVFGYRLVHPLSRLFQFLHCLYILPFQSLQILQIQSGIDRPPVTFTEAYLDELQALFSDFFSSDKILFCYMQPAQSLK